jgi:hypothetical protein
MSCHIEIDFNDDGTIIMTSQSINKVQVRELTPIPDDGLVAVRVNDPRPGHASHVLLLGGFELVDELYDLVNMRVENVV